MPGVYDIFRYAADMVERVPFQWRAIAGATAGVGYQLTNDNEDLSLGAKVGKGLFIGTSVGLGMGNITRLAGRVAQAGTGIGRFAVTSKINAVQRSGFAALRTPGMFMLGGAFAGAMMAPPGSRGTGAIIGGGLGLATIPAMKLYSGYESMGGFGKITTLAGVAGIPVAVGILGNRGINPEAEAAAYPGPGATIDYTALDGGMNNRITAMNASGDIVLGLHGRQHG